MADDEPVVVDDPAPAPVEEVEMSVLDALKEVSYVFSTALRQVQRMSPICF
jgi:hypothetical protein